MEDSRPHADPDPSGGGRSVPGRTEAGAVDLLDRVESGTVVTTVGTTGVATDLATVRTTDVPTDVATDVTTDAATIDDPYGAATAEFYDLLATAQWESFGLDLLELLDRVDPSVGPIVDVGAGTGIGLSYLRAAAPGATIFAIEPSKAMRTALHTRLAIDPGLRAITTVDPRPLASAQLPERAAALVASAALGHLTDDERDRLWRYVAEHMPAGAPAVLEVLPPARSITVPPTRYRELEVGDLVYEGWQEGEPIDDRTMAWTMTYRVRRDREIVAEYRVRSTWRCFGVDDVRAEVEAHGLTLREHADCVVVTHAA